MRLAVFLGMCLLAAPSLAPAADMNVKISVPGYSEADAAVVVETFRRNCRPLGDEFWSDVTEVQVEISKETAQYRLNRGWATNVHLALKYSDKPQIGPAFATGAGVLAGNTLHYDIGGGPNAGYLAGKRSSQYLCGLSFNEKGDDVFVPVPQFAFLDRLQ